MIETIKVYVVNKRRKNLYLHYIDPLTGKVVEKSAKTSNRKEADRAAGALENQLRDGRYQKPSRMTWEAFREYYSANTHWLQAVRPRTTPR